MLNTQHNAWAKQIINGFFQDIMKQKCTILFLRKNDSNSVQPIILHLCGILRLKWPHPVNHL